MRALNIEAEQQKQVLIEKARQEADNARKAAKIRHQKIVSDRSALLQAIKNLKKQNKQLDADIVQTEKNIARLKQEEIILTEKLAETNAINKELSGFIRGNTKDLSTLLNQSLQSAFKKDREDFLKPMISQDQFPSMDDIRKMVDLLIEEIKLSGAVRLTKSMLVDRTGREIDANFLVIGNFTTMYHLENEIGFALYSDKSQRLFSLSKLPGKRIEQRNTAYMQGQSESAYMDISKGGALRQLTHQLNLIDQIPKGGPIVWPIVGILIIAILIILERVFFLLRKRVNADAFTQAVCSHASKGEWQDCLDMCEKSSKKSIPKVLKAGLECRDMSRTDMENALQEAILNEIPSMERFLSTLGMLAAIAPLLGLLGTVTGMINTFHVITYYGTGDPRMMSGGISEALVTTMLGLSVAIPIMLVHTLLTRKVENTIAQMEEKAVSFVNMVFKNRN
jgi:biopolymer transport protein ExbB